MGDLVTIEQQDVFTVDLTPATVITVYLLPRLNSRLVPQLEMLAPDTRIVSHDFDIEGTLHDGKWSMTAPFFGRTNELYDAATPEDTAHYPPIEHRVFLWVTPLRRQIDGSPILPIDLDLVEGWGFPRHG